MMYFFPAGQKSLPYMKYMRRPFAEEILDFIAEKATSGIRLKTGDFVGIGKRSIDEQAFHNRLEKEGVIDLSENAYDEL